MVHKSLLSIAVASMMLAGSLAATTPAFAYKALAMSDWGEWGFARHYPTPERARINAVSACERTAGEGACREISTWEGNDWYFVGVTCFYSSYTAASPQGFARAEYLAYNKADIAGDFDCWTAVKKY